MTNTRLAKVVLRRPITVMNRGDDSNREWQAEEYELVLSDTEGEEDDYRWT